MKRMTIWAVCLLGLLIVTNSAEAKKKSGFDINKIQKMLVNAEGKKVKKADLGSKKYILLYFSAHWCPPCRAFTPKLVEYYNKNNNGEFEVIFISADRNADKMKEYMEEASMPWPGIKYNKISRSNLRGYCGQGIPCLVLIDPQGKVLSDSYVDGKYVGPMKVLRDLGKMLKLGSKSKNPAPGKAPSTKE